MLIIAHSLASRLFLKEFESSHRADSIDQSVFEKIEFYSRWIQSTTYIEIGFLVKFLEANLARLI